MKPWFRVCTTFYCSHARAASHIVLDGPLEQLGASAGCRASTGGATDRHGRHRRNASDADGGRGRTTVCGVWPRGRVLGGAGGRGATRGGDVDPRELLGVQAAAVACARRVRRAKRECPRALLVQAMRSCLEKACRCLGRKEKVRDQGKRIEALDGHVLGQARWSWAGGAGRWSQPCPRRAFHMLSSRCSPSW